MGRDSPDHNFPATPTGDDHLWRPGSTSYPRPGRETMDPLRSEQELRNLYEDISESFYDLSLKDIVDPCYSISGNLKAIVAEAELKSDVQAASQSRKRKGTVFSWSIANLSFSFSLPGLRAKSKSGSISSSARPNVHAPTTSPSHSEDEQSSASKRSLSADRSSSKPRLPYFYAHNKRSSPESRAFSTSRVHPSNQCSTCSSYTIFFKCRCLVCGRLYCSNCAKQYMDNLSDGRKCKDACNREPLSRRLSRKVGTGCWPFCGTIDVQRFPVTKGA